MKILQKTFNLKEWSGNATLTYDYKTPWREKFAHKIPTLWWQGNLQIGNNSLHDAGSQIAAHKWLTNLSSGFSYHSLSAQNPNRVAVEPLGTHYSKWHQMNWECQRVSHNASFWKSQTSSVNDSIYDLYRVFLEIPVKIASWECW